MYYNSIHSKLYLFDNTNHYITFDWTIMHKHLYLHLKVINAGISVLNNSGNTVNVLSHNSIKLLKVIQYEWWADCWEYVSH